MGRDARVWFCALGLFGFTAAGGCANKLNSGGPLTGEGGVVREGGAADGGGANGGGGKGNGKGGNGSGTDLDAALISDAFFINDPAPPICGPDGGMTPAPDAGGTIVCPDDKNREGCPCTNAGASQACWPGKRANRNHGVCKDGVAQCVRTSEFGLRWGACNGYKLPTPGAVSGPEACGCFSDGEWAVTDLAPCIDQSTGKTFLYSSHLDSTGVLICDGTDGKTPPPVPPEDWNSSTLKVSCAGHFKLCYTIKAGNVNATVAGDCTISKQCVDTWYQNEGQTQKLPNLGAWSSSDSTCAQRFVDVGGYGEMSVEGQSIECDAINDGQGAPLVFRRSGYCPQSCRTSPNTPQCKSCATGGSGMFGP